MFKGLFPADALNPRATKMVLCGVRCLCSSEYFSWIEDDPEIL